MSDTTFKKPLFIFELANNHMGSVDHGVRVIEELGSISKEFADTFDFALKFQYRELDSFIHPDFKGRQDIKYVKRFEETRLSEDQFKALKAAVDAQGFTGVCTPFDEPSVGKVEEHGYDFIKVASCSFTDWPLLERMAQSPLPVIASTAGATVEELDRVVSFFTHRDKHFALMHCVAEYPAPAEHLEINQVGFLKRRYPDLVIGYSAHEDPANTDVVKVAVAQGGWVFEKHVGVKTDEYSINDYSATPEQVKAWLRAARDAFTLCGSRDGRPESREKERSTLRALQRGVFVRDGVKKGDKITLDNSFLAIPTTEGQMVANDMSKYLDVRAKGDIAASGAVLQDGVELTDTRKEVLAIVKQVNQVLKDAQVRVPGQVDLEISHHYGIEKYAEYGCSLITVVNREYCKKLIVVLPGQKHPEQWHEEKEETFHVVHGKVMIRLDGKEGQYGPGDVVTVERGVRHYFTSETGAVIEEISSTHKGKDSFYSDKSIMENKARKTHLTYWTQVA